VRNSMLFAPRRTECLWLSGLIAEPSGGLPRIPSRRLGPFAVLEGNEGHREPRVSRTTTRRSRPRTRRQQPTRWPASIAPRLACARPTTFAAAGHDAYSDGRGHSWPRGGVLASAHPGVVAAGRSRTFPGPHPYGASFLCSWDIYYPKASFG